MENIIVKISDLGFTNMELEELIIIIKALAGIGMSESDIKLELQGYNIYL